MLENAGGVKVNVAAIFPAKQAGISFVQKRGNI